ncbi:hypothetical protein IVA99_31785 [Bradyrhizobium sp. 162]|nr:hypothetical protein [Bradyrhizobium sp. 162]
MPVRQSYNVGTAASPGRLLTMPAWERGKALGAKLVTVFPKSGASGLPPFPRFTCCSTATGRPRAMIDGETLTNRKRDFLRTMTPALLTDGLRIEGGI